MCVVNLHWKLGSVEGKKFHAHTGASSLLLLFPEHCDLLASSSLLKLKRLAALSMQFCSFAFFFNKGSGVLQRYGIVAVLFRTHLSKIGL